MRLPQSSMRARNAAATRKHASVWLQRNFGHSVGVLLCSSRNLKNEHYRSCSSRTFGCVDRQSRVANRPCVFTQEVFFILPAKECVATVISTSARLLRPFRFIAFPAKNDLRRFIRLWRKLVPPLQFQSQN